MINTTTIIVQYWKPYEGIIFALWGIYFWILIDLDTGSKNKNFEQKYCDILWWVFSHFPLIVVCQLLNIVHQYIPTDEDNKTYLLPRWEGEAIINYCQSPTIAIIYRRFFFFGYPCCILCLSVCVVEIVVKEWTHLLVESRTEATCLKNSCRRVRHNVSGPATNVLIAQHLFFKSSKNSRNCRKLTSIVERIRCHPR